MVMGVSQTQNLKNLPFQRAKMEVIDKCFAGQTSDTPKIISQGGAILFEEMCLLCNIPPKVNNVEKLHPPSRNLCLHPLVYHDGFPWVFSR